MKRDGPGIENVTDYSELLKRKPMDESRTTIVEHRTRSGRRLHVYLVLLAVTIFMLLSVATMKTVLPQSDEALYANPGYNLAYNGHLGTTICELRGFMPPSMALRTYWQPPAYFFATAAWFRMVGFSIIKVRVLSMLFALVALASWYWLVKRLTGSEAAAAAAVSCIAIDFFFLLSASEGRMDMMCAGLGAASLAAYVLLRARSLPLAAFTSHVFATLSILTHPVGVLYWLGLLFLIFRLDRRKMTIRMWAAAAAPCLAGVSLWAVYILPNPIAFSEQLRGNLGIVNGTFNEPGLSDNPLLRSIELEWRHRYQGPFGLSSGVGGAQRLKSAVLVCYVAAILGCLYLGRTRKMAGLAALAWLAVISAVYLAAGSPSKYYYYLPHFTAFAAACFGAFVAAAWTKGSKAGWAVALIALAVSGLQIGGSLYRIGRNEYGKSFLPVTETIKKQSKAGSLVMGPAELWFGLEHDRFTLHDPALGAASGRRPDVFVMNSLYRDLHQRGRAAGPGTYAHVEKLLETSRLVYEDRNYSVYVPKEREE